MSCVDPINATVLLAQITDTHVFKRKKYPNCNPLVHYIPQTLGLTLYCNTLLYLDKF